MFKKVLLGSMSFVAGSALLALVVTAAICGVVGGLVPGEEDDQSELREKPEPDAPRT
jgi:hypothetical protein